MKKNSHHPNPSSGFTLVEVMIVVLVLTILMTIAVANFQGARDKSQFSTCLSNLRHGLALQLHQPSVRR